MSIGGYGEVAPSGGVRPSNLVGRWVVTQGMASEWPGEAAYLELAPTGTLGGRLQLFGALPPLTLQDGAWWWVQATSTLVLEFRAPPVEDLVMEMRVPLAVTTIEPNRVAAGADGKDHELVRAPEHLPLAPPASQGDDWHAQAGDDCAAAIQPPARARFSAFAAMTMMPVSTPTAAEARDRRSRQRVVSAWSCRRPPSRSTARAWPWRGAGSCPGRRGPTCPACPGPRRTRGR